ncbi:MAG: hypothetical protein SFV51_16830 [Bryobacteraceae bacterium]|nr:hypothetical protein [Bryobacteraceae bacterium]
MRGVVDKEFCSSDHRRRFRTSSARVLRDAGELAEDYDDYLAVIKQPEKKGAQTSAGKLGMAIAGGLGVVVAVSMIFMPSSGAPKPGGPPANYSLSGSPLGQRLLSVLPDSPKINLRQDFRMGMGDWVSAGSTASDYVAGALKTDRLKLWKPSIQLSNYQMEFQAAIERKAVGWAFRASDLGNYYGTKIHVGGKDGGRSEIERFVTVGGREVERVRLPIPVSIRPDTLYRVRVRVKGDQFLTSVDGQVVDTWKDRRLKKGGIGFFAERGESASVRWVSLSEPESFLSRLFAFGFRSHPLAEGDDPEVEWLQPVLIVVDEDGADDIGG